MGNNQIVFVVFAVVVLFLVVFFISFARYFNLWIQAMLAAARISFTELMMMSLRKIDPRTIVECKIMAVQGGLGETVTTQMLESHYLAGGHVRQVVEALVAANRNGLDLSFEEAAAIDLAGRNVAEVVKSGLMPGRGGTVETVVSTAGTVLVDGEHLEAICEEGSIAAGQPVEIVEVRDRVAVVRPRH